MDDRTCSIVGCGKPREKRGWCSMHYRRWLRHGDASTVRPDRGGITGQSVAETFWSHVDKNGPVSPHRPDIGPCWVWQRPLTASGYGQLRVNGEHAMAHRHAYALLVGPIPEGLQIDHLCRVRACVRPDHLEPVTPQENTLRGDTIPAANTQKSHCPHGHPYDAMNTAYRNGRRHCRECSRIRQRKDPTS